MCRSQIHKIKIPKVPDRGGRTCELEAPPPEMPKFMQRKTSSNPQAQRPSKYFLINISFFNYYCNLLFYDKEIVVAEVGEEVEATIVDLITVTKIGINQKVIMVKVNLLELQTNIFYINNNCIIKDKFQDTDYASSSGGGGGYSGGGRGRGGGNRY